MKRGYRQISGARVLRRRPNYRKRAHRYGLVPQYQGFQPRSFSRGEWKYLDTVFPAGITSSGNFVLLNGLVPGTGASQRIGMKIAIRSVEFRFEANNVAAASLSQPVRCMLLQDRQPNGVAPAALTDFITPGDYLGLRNLAQRKRFRILLDRSKELSTYNQSGDAWLVHKYMKFRKPLVVEYNAGCLS